MSEPSVDAAREERLRSAFASEELSALRLLMYVRAVVSAAIVIFLVTRFPDAGGVYWACLTVLFGALGVAQYLIGRSLPHARWHRYAFVTLDLALVTFIIIFPNPFLSFWFPPPMLLRFPNFDFLYLVVGMMAFSYAPSAVIWAGLAAILAWGAGVLWILSLPDTISNLDYPNLSSMPMAEQIRIATKPHFLNFQAWSTQSFIMLLFGGVLASAVWRSRRLVRREARAERARANLSRYFSPGLIEELAESDEPLGAVREQNVAVLFADIVGFTKMSEGAPPEQVIALLRDFHGRMAREVFAHDGTVDKYIGDAIMATFGTPRAGSRDASNALGCAQAMLRSVQDWNHQRTSQGKPAVEIGIGLHFGTAVMGDIGDERRLEYAVVGDTVNVASRLEALTRKVGTPLVVSDEAVAAARHEDGGAGLVATLIKAGTSAVPGRKEKVTYWQLDGVAPTAA